MGRLQYSTCSARPGACDDYMYCTAVVITPATLMSSMRTPVRGSGPDQGVDDDADVLQLGRDPERPQHAQHPEDPGPARVALDLLS